MAKQTQKDQRSNPPALDHVLTTAARAENAKGYLIQETGATEDGAALLRDSAVLALTDVIKEAGAALRELRSGSPLAFDLALYEAVLREEKDRARNRVADRARRIAMDMGRLAERLEVRDATVNDLGELQGLSAQLESAVGGYHARVEALKLLGQLKGAGS